MKPVEALKLMKHYQEKLELEDLALPIMEELLK